MNFNMFEWLVEGVRGVMLCPAVIVIKLISVLQFKLKIVGFLLCLREQKLLYAILWFLELYAISLLFQYTNTVQTATW